ncbi:MAG: amidohydrolase family protein [Chloroflexota bacterium]|nr:amidohydrolase family protein [Chloroflexota bacterium]
MTDIDLILTGGDVLTMNDSSDRFSPGAVAIGGGAIQAVGPADEIATSHRAREVVDCSGCAVMPGLINGHTHTPMTLLRGLADDLRLDVWLMGYMMPVEREFVRPDFCWLGAQLACAEMFRSGVTCFGDMYYYEEAVADATAEAGMRGVCAQSILKFPTPDAASYDEGLRLAHDFVARWAGHNLIVPAIGPHAAYTATAKMLQQSTQLALEYDVPIHIHIAETEQEVEEQLASRKQLVVPWVEEQGLFEAKVTAHHCVHVEENQLRILQRHGAGICHNPSSNLKLASGFAPVAKMLALGIPVAIGTDGAASNNDLDMFEEIRLAALLAKGVSADPTALPARQALAMATRLGAQALHIADRTGSLEVGKRADVAVVDLERIHLTPQFHRGEDSIYSLLVYSAKSSDVLHVLCDGHWMMRDRELLTLDVEELRQRAAKTARRIDTFLTAREESVLSKLVAIGGVSRVETFEVQVKVHLDDASRVKQLLESGEVPVVRSSWRRQYDTYFLFGDAETSRLRYREDEILAPDGDVDTVVYRLTLIGETKEREFPRSVLLSRSRFDAPATHSHRFYREYFQPQDEIRVHKDRRRYHIRYGGTDFALNLDSLIQPQPPREQGSPGVYLEIKSRTWSAQDAERKAELMGELLDLFDVEDKEIVKAEYMELTTGENTN